MNTKRLFIKIAIITLLLSTIFISGCVKKSLVEQISELKAEKSTSAEFGPPVWESGEYWVVRYEARDLYYFSYVVPDKSGLYVLENFASEERHDFRMVVSPIDFTIRIYPSFRSDLYSSYKLVDFPLTIGKNWTSEWIPYGTIHAEVVGKEKIKTILDEKECYLIKYSPKYEGGAIHYCMDEGIIIPYLEFSVHRRPVQVSHGKLTVDQITDERILYETAVAKIMEAKEKYEKAELKNLYVSTNPEDAVKLYYGYMDSGEYEKAFAMVINPRTLEPYSEDEKQQFIAELKRMYGDRIKVNKLEIIEKKKVSENEYHITINVTTDVDSILGKGRTIKRVFKTDAGWKVMEN